MNQQKVQLQQSQALGPLRVSSVNPRYFAVASATSVASVGGSGGDGAEQVVYLTGSHVNNNFHDGMGPGAPCAERPEEFDFDAYLAFLQEHGHNLIRLWRWEQFLGYLSGADVHLCMTPQPWPRTGPGKAKDGKPKFDLGKFDPRYFERLRERVIAAGKVGIYVSVMFFEGFSLHLTDLPDNIEGHPFHAANNINNISIHSIVDYQTLPLDPRIQAIQESYMRKVIDTLHDLPNLLYEVANESSGQDAGAMVLPGMAAIETPIGDTTEWQYWVIRFVKQVEQEHGYDPHPIGMTFLYPVAEQSRANEPLWRSPADWISPGFDEGVMPQNTRWSLDPPANDGSKVVLSDTDHYSPMGSDALWAWKSFLRGHNPLLYDLGIAAGARPAGPAPWTPPYESYEAARYAMGDTLRLAQRIDLAHMAPHGEQSSTGYALVNPGHEYVVLEPSEKGASFTVTLPAGTYDVEWYCVNSREWVHAEAVVGGGNPGATRFTAPFAVGGPAVLYLKRSGG